MGFKEMFHSDGRSVPFTHDQLCSILRTLGQHPPKPQEACSKEEYWRILTNCGRAGSLLDYAAQHGVAAAVANPLAIPVTGGDAVSTAPAVIPDAVTVDYPMRKAEMVRMLRERSIVVGDDARQSIAEIWQRIVAAGLDSEARSMGNSTPVAPRAMVPHVPASGAESKLAEALRAIVGDAVNVETVRAIVAEEIAKQEPRTIVQTFVVRDAVKSELPGGEYVRPEAQKVCDLLRQGLNVMLVGPAGSGKSHFAEQVAKLLGVPYSSNSCSAGMSESAFAGWLLPVAESGRFVYVSTEFVRHYETGGLHLIDEGDRADANLLTFLNQAFANGHFYIPQRHESPRVDRHKDFHCIMACNTYGTGADRQYVSAGQLDASTLDRFWVVDFDYDKVLEKRIVRPEVAEWGKTLRKRVSDMKIRRPVSTRKLAQISTMIASGWTFEDCKESFFASWSVDERAKVEA